MGISYAPAVQVRSGAERATLVRRTYGLVFLGILATIAGTAFTLAQPALLGAVVAHPFITMIATFVPLIMVQRSAREYPKNIILTFLFTFVMGVMIAPGMYIAERSVPGIVMQAGALTFTAFGALSLYAVFSRRDFSAWGAFFFVGLIVLLVASVLNSKFIWSVRAAVPRRHSSPKYATSNEVIVVPVLLVKHAPKFGISVPLRNWPSARSVAAAAP